MHYKYKVGDILRVVAHGFGFSPNEIGEKITVTKHGEYKEGPGYQIKENLGNNKVEYLGYWDGYHGEESFGYTHDYLFRIGEEVEIKQSGYGVGKRCIGDKVAIIGLGTLSGEPGYMIYPAIGNCGRGYCIGEKSFLLKNVDEVDKSADLPSKVVSTKRKQHTQAF